MAIKECANGGGGIHLYKGYKIGVAVPAYNEHLLIDNTLKSIPDFVDRVYAVDDASTDSTYDCILAHDDPRVVALRHDANGGVGAAIVTAYKQALIDGMDVVAVMAGDNQMDPAHLTCLLDPIIDSRADFTKGDRLSTRELRRGMSRWRLLGNVLLTYLTKIASGYWGLSDSQNGYVAISRGALELLDLGSLYRGYAFENDLIVKLNVHDVVAVNVPIPARYGSEKSKIKYFSFIARTSGYLLRAFAWRISAKYLHRNTRRAPARIIARGNIARNDRSNEDS